MKILLINTGQYRPLNGYNYPLNTFQPVGIGYLANVLRDHGYIAAILDVLAEGYNHEEIKGKNIYVGLSEKLIKQKIQRFNPDIIGVTIPFTSQAKAGHEMAKFVKETNNKIKVIVGGSYPTTYPEYVLKDKNIDFIVLGEGEITLLELVDKISRKTGNFQTIKGIAFRDKKVIITKSRKPLSELDKYSISWDLLPMKKYFDAAYEIKSSRSVSTYGKKWATLFTSRGCPFNCTFCVGHAVMGRKWRSRSVGNVINEMEYLIKTFGIEHFDIEDDNFTLDKERAKKICDKIIEKGWRIQWSTPNGIRADTVDEELIIKMKQSGCVRTIVAPESGDQWVINNLMDKKINLKKVKQVVRWCKKYNLAVDAFFLLGMPGERSGNIKKTIEYAKELKKIGLDECLFGIVVPHKGTVVYDIATKNGWMPWVDSDEDLIEKMSKEESFIETPYLTVKQIQNFQKLANRTNSLIPIYRIKLMIYMAIKTPKRFLKLLMTDFKKRLGFIGGKLGV